MRRKKIVAARRNAKNIAASLFGRFCRKNKPPPPAPPPPHTHTHTHGDVTRTVAKPLFQSHRKRLRCSNFLVVYLLSDNYDHDLYNLSYVFYISSSSQFFFFFFFFFFLTATQVLFHQTDIHSPLILCSILHTPHKSNRNGVVKRSCLPENMFCTTSG